MSLIDSSYFIGEKNIPNTSYGDVSSSLENLIVVREKDFLTKVLGYELFKLFEQGLLQATPEPRMVDILLGKEYTGFNGRATKWGGLISVLTDTPWLTVSLSSANDLYFTVGIGSAPADSDITYVNLALAGANYRVVQRGFGPLEALAEDNSNVATADIQINPSGGFTWLNGISFSQSDKYAIQFVSTDLDVSEYEVATQPESPIADYVYYWYLRGKVNSAAGTGQVESKNENSVIVSSVRQQAKAWNDMVDKICLLKEFLMVEYLTYPEFQQHAGSIEFWAISKRINAHNF